MMQKDYESKQSDMFEEPQFSDTTSAPPMPTLQKALTKPKAMPGILAGVIRKRKRKYGRG